MTITDDNLIPLSDCVDRSIYTLTSPTGAELGVFVSALRQFIVVDHTAAEPRLVAEHHVEGSSTYGTAQPLRLVGFVADDIPLRTSMGSVCAACGTEARFRAVEPVEGFGLWTHTEATGCENMDPQFLTNMKLMIYLESLARTTTATPN